MNDRSNSSKCDTILVLDFGSQYTHLIIRRLHELGIYCDLRPFITSLKDLDYTPKGIILSGGPCSVYDENAPHAAEGIVTSCIPILGICYGMQEIAYTFGGKVEGGNKEYGGSNVIMCDGCKSDLYRGIPEKFEVWMSHGDSVYDTANQFKITAYSNSKAIASFENKEKSIYAVQYHPEVANSPFGKQVIMNFIQICGAQGGWSMSSLIENQIAHIKKTVADSHVICAVSGGVDSTVAATLMKKAIGDKFHAVLVDTGLLRHSEGKEAEKYLKGELGINVEVINASHIFIPKLAGIIDPEKKRKIIGGEFIKVFEDYLKTIKTRIEGRGDRADYLMQGTLYSDVIESSPLRPGSQTIKSHHNVGGLLKNMKFELIEPLRELFKDEVRQLGELMGLRKEILFRHPFPGPGLGIRVIGEVTQERVDKLRKADHVFISEIKKANIYYHISQAFCVLLPTKSVGVMGDARTYNETICIRAVISDDFMTSSCYFFDSNLLKTISSRIMSEVDGVNRVLYDTSTKPPATIEWE